MKSWRFFFGSTAITLCIGSLSSACGDQTELETDDSVESVSGLEQALTSASFTMSAAYYGTNSSGTCSSSSKRSIVGFEPSDAGTFPVFIYLTGTKMPFNGPEAKLFTEQMAGRGFVAAAVDYDSSSYPSCSLMTKKASCIFSASSANSAVAKLCARAKADCSKGIVVSGFSQGANLAALAKNYDARAGGAYLIGHGDKASGIIDVSSCADNAKTTLLPSQMRSINGENDEFFGANANGVRSQLQKVVGVSCAGSWNCLQADGSGWAMVRPSELADGTANHCYYYQNGDRACTSNNGFDATFLNGSAPWSLAPSLDWLASKATP
jgi:hypothetical protein